MARTPAHRVKEDLSMVEKGDILRVSFTSEDGVVWNRQITYKRFAADGEELLDDRGRPVVLYKDEAGVAEPQALQASIVQINQDLGLQDGAKP